MSKKSEKEFDIPRGESKKRPSVRKSSRKLGRGFGDLMNTPSPVEGNRDMSGFDTEVTAQQIPGNQDLTAQNVAAAGVVSGAAAGRAPGSTSGDAAGVAPGVVSGDAAGVAPGVAAQGTDQVISTEGQLSQDEAASGEEEETLGMDAQSIESVMTGNPKSSSGVESRAERKKKRRRKKALVVTIVIAAILVVGALITGGVMLYTSDYFKIDNIEINGALHLTDDEVLQLANVDDEDTLLRVDTETISTRLKRDAWVKDVAIDKKFPDTLVINITERAITAIVEVPTTKDSGSSVSTSSSATSKSTTVRMWAISADKIWLMPIPDQNSEIGKSLNQQIYADLAGIMHIVDVLPSVNPEIGCYCTDATLQCAIDVVASMTTELKSQVKYVKASDAQSTTLILNNGVEVAVGTNEDMRDKERIVLELLEKHEGKISFINVRNVNNPTWRTL